MARLRYNGLGSGSAGSVVAASLSGSHTDSTTTLTFAAALTYNNGTAVPTITGSDYFMLSVLNASGQVQEIVKVTAYTAAATTATVERGQSGTTGVSHASGAVVINAPTSGDFAQVVKAVRTASDLSFNTTGWQNVDTGMDLTLTNVQVGDELEYIPNFFLGSPANTFAFDVATIVGGSPVNYFGTAGGATENGVAGWLSGTGSMAVTGSAFYTVQAGDLSGDSVTLRLRIRPANTTTRVISASSLTPARVYARNCR